MTISSTIGTDSKKMARRMLPVVKLVSEPRRAIRKSRWSFAKLYRAMIEVVRGEVVQEGSEKSRRAERGSAEAD